jgi:hypothetical protein
MRLRKLTNTDKPNAGQKNGTPDEGEEDRRSGGCTGFPLGQSSLCRTLTFTLSRLPTLCTVSWHPLVTHEVSLLFSESRIAVCIALLSKSFAPR